MRRFPTLFLGTACVALSAISTPLHAENGHVHEHGVSRMDVALAGSILQITLHGPGHNFVGFEHEAQTKEERQSVQAAEAALNDAAGLFALPSAAGCVAGRTSVSLPAQGDHDTAHEHGNHGHDHDHDRNHGHDGLEHEHSDWRAEYTFECTRPGDLNRIEVQVFAAFPQTQEIRFQLLAPASQSGGTLNSADTVIAVPRA
jgi:hypothetical protein